MQHTDESLSLGRRMTGCSHAGGLKASRAAHDRHECTDRGRFCEPWEVEWYRGKTGTKKVGVVNTHGSLVPGVREVRRGERRS
jgi:hypothetical protein